jgi:RNA polymerase sigma factor (sigma-70 family)
MKKQKDDPAEIKKTRRKSLRAAAFGINLGRRLKTLHGKQIRFYFLAGDSPQQIAKELRISKRYCNGNERAARSAVRLAIRGSVGYVFRRPFQGLVNRRDRERMENYRKRHVDNQTLARRVAKSLRSTANPEDLYGYRQKISRAAQLESLTDPISLESLPEEQHPAEPESPQEVLDNTFLEKRIEQVLQTLTYREREIIKMRYRLFGEKKRTYEEIGRIFRTTKEWIRRVEMRAIRRMQAPTISRMLEGFVDLPESYISENGREDAYELFQRNGPVRESK